MSFTKLTVVREQWDRGGDGRLFSEKGLCCLGFAGRAQGYTDEQMSGLGCPEDLLVDHGKNLWEDTPFLREHDDFDKFVDSKLTCDAMAINDNSQIDDQVREEQLTKLFASHGIELEFE